MLTLNTLPYWSVLRIYATVERVTPESAAEGDAAERGWVDSLDSTNIHESRNYVTPILEIKADENGRLTDGADYASIEEYEALHAESLEAVARVISELGAYSTDDGSTLYAEDEVTYDYSTADTFRYCIHAHVKRYDRVRGWVEDDVNITASL